MTINENPYEYLAFVTPKNGYEQRHNVEARNLKNPWGTMFRGLHGHCFKTEKQWGKPADDDVLAPEIRAIASALLSLLNFDNGQLDIGKCDAALRDLLKDAGFTPEQVEEL